MNARTEISKSITHCLVYGQNHEKGGECFFSQDLDPTLSPEEQAKDWETMSNDYKRNICHIIVSFSDNDTKKLRAMNPRDMVRREREILLTFFKELKSRGNDITESPYAVFHHGNTDNEHFHIYVHMTNRKGKRWENKFVRKNAIRSAAKVSLDFGLEGSRKAMMRELAHQQHVNGQSTEERAKRTRSRERSSDQQTINERMYRAERNREAEKRKANFKLLIEKTVASNPDNVVIELRKFGIELFQDPSLGIAMKAVDKDGKERRYALKKHLKVSDSVIAKLSTLKLPADYVSVTDKKKAEAKAHVVEKVSAGRTAHPSAKGSQRTNGMPISGASSSVLNVGGGSHGGTTQQGDVNPDGSRNINRDDLDEEWRRRNGYHM